ncbi:hypothetical protein C8039_03490 [Halogeometricum sp. wsp3]|nr:hypothetical protein C8039_03490 [Halogeometricum sp. wsp3]
MRADVLRGAPTAGEPQLSRPLRVERSLRRVRQRVRRLVKTRPDFRERGVADRFGIDPGPVAAATSGGTSRSVLSSLELCSFRAYSDLSLGREAVRLCSLARPNNPQYVWTWVTSVFSHAPFGFYHVFGNAIIIYVFGRLVEQQIGSTKFAVVFLVSGALAGLGRSQSRRFCERCGLQIRLPPGASSLACRATPPQGRSRR